ncbi:MAG: ATP-binding protein [Alphaproteobacteria bacterium]
MVIGKTDFQKSRLFLKLGIWARKNNLSRKLAIGLSFCAVISGLATYFALTQADSREYDSKKVLILLNIDLTILLILSIVIIRRMVQVWGARKEGKAGSKLQVRLVFLFGLVAATPTILVAVFSALFFNAGLQSWFSDNVKTAVNESLIVAEAYLKEHRQIITGDVLVVANAINREIYHSGFNVNQIKQVLTTTSMEQGLNEAVIFNIDGKVIAYTGYTFSLRFEEVPYWAVDKANRGEIAVLTGETSDRVRALAKLDTVGDFYLYVGRFVDPRVLAHMDRANKSVSEYKRLEGQRSNIEITFSMIFILAALLLLTASMWIGLNLATQLLKPITALIDAAGQVREGDLEVKVEENSYADELSILSRAFNRMTSQLLSQRERLVETNYEIDKRRRFIETVLAGVSAGVVGLDSNGNISIINRSACDLLSRQPEELKELHIIKAIPEFTNAFDIVYDKPSKPFNGEIKANDKILLVRLAAEMRNNEVVGYVFTFDDITELEQAQRKAAWADVARRIAHEIKNPLTPIQLSAERLSKKYKKQIKEDVETFDTCIATIIRQVADIGRMVDEFSAFARMPAPQMKEYNICEIVQSAVFLQKTAYPEITFETKIEEPKIYMRCDNRQLNQAVTNIIKNAIEAVHDKEKHEENFKGNILILVLNEKNYIKITVIDNGKGLPDKETREKLTEPYVTTRAKGTGLGLAIVKKIMEDHKGELLIDDNENGGAKVSLRFKNMDS